MKINYYELNSFAKSSNGGNLAAVVLNSDNLSENIMQKISKSIGFSETAFVSNSDCADFKIRFFTPNKEVDLCGHATIGAYSALLNNKIITPGLYKQETKAGILDVEVRCDLSIMMNQSLPIFYEIIHKAEIASSLNISVDDIVDDIPIQIVSTGLRDILIPIKNLSILNSITPNFEKIINISKKYDVVGYHAFTLESINNSAAHCRNFAPLYDILEESATGTSNGALACYLYKYKKLKDNQINNIIFEQGYCMNKPSEIKVSLITENKNILQVKVGGNTLGLKISEIEI